MKIFLFLFLFFPCILLSQDIERIKKADTIYIYFKNDNIDQIKNLANRKFQSFNYIFVFDVKDIGPRQSFSFFEDLRSTIPQTQWVKKSFLKKNKNITVNYYFLKKLGFFDAEQLLLTKKKLYLIDCENVKFFKIKILEVKISNREYLVPIE